MKLIRYKKTADANGWMHEIIVDTGHGMVMLLDDCSELRITANSLEVPLSEAYDLWNRYKMGTDMFPHDVGDAPEAKWFNTDLDFLLWIGNSAALSQRFEWKGCPQCGTGPDEGCFDPASHRAVDIDA